MAQLTMTMCRRKRLTMAAIAAVVLSFSAATAAPDLSLTGNPPSAGGRILTFVTEAPDFNWRIFLRRNDGGAAVRVCIDVTPLIGPSPHALDKPNLSVDGRTDNTCTEVGSVDKTVVIGLSGMLPAEGEFKGQLGLVVDNSRTPYDVVVTRRKPSHPPTMGFVGVGGDGRLAMTSDRAAVDWPLTLRRNDAQDGDAEVWLEVGPFAGPSGTVIQPSLQGADGPLAMPLKLPKGRQQSFRLVVEAPQDGT
jgi:hypothetical protein